MTIDISAELIEISNEQYYADWTVVETVTEDGETVVEINVTGYDDAEYLDLTPIFDVLSQTHESVTDSFFLKEVRFSPRKPSATIFITSAGRQDEDHLTEDFIVTQKSGGEFTLSEDSLSKIDYKNPPLIVGYCSSEESLAIELRNS